MIADQTTQLVPTADTQLATLDALRSMLAQYPGLPAVSWNFNPDRPGHLSGSVRGYAQGAVDAFHAMFGGYRSHSQPTAREDGSVYTCHRWHGNFGDLRLYVYGSDTVDAFTAFTLTHNPDPQEWTPAERAEYRALAGTAAA